jgi:hypothetical protein
MLTIEVDELRRKVSEAFVEYFKKTREYDVNASFSGITGILVAAFFGTFSAYGINESDAKRIFHEMLGFLKKEYSAYLKERKNES